MRWRLVAFGARDEKGHMSSWNFFLEEKRGCVIKKEKVGLYTLDTLAPLSARRGFLSTAFYEL
jgi:hypothetical protein